jgi:hypothetical protein
MNEESKNLHGNEEFEKVLGVILNDILRVSLVEAEKRYKNELREEDSKASDIRR